MTITVNNLTKSFGADARVVDGVSFEIRPGEMFFLLGPSGCGKTTVLRMLAGFLEPDGGDILFEQKRMNGVAAQDRNTAMVFQNYAIWPHLTVYENVVYGPRAGNSPTPIAARRTRCGWCGSRNWRSVNRPSFRADSNSAWPWRARWRRSRT